MPSPDAATPLDALLDRVERKLPDAELPVQIFGNQNVFDAEIDRIFGRTWVFLAHETEIPENNDYVLRRIGTDPVIVVRDSSGTLQVMSNYCPHRATEICRADQGHASRFICPYHGWTFKNNGELIGAPHIQSAYRTLDKKQWGLMKAAKVDTHQGMIFATLSEEAPPLKEYLGGAAWMLDAIMGLHPDGMKVLGPPDRWRVKADWKNGAENFGGDNYHVHIAHGSTEKMGIMTGTREWGNYACQYDLGDGHVFCGGRLADFYGPEWEYWGLPKDLVAQFDFGGLDDQQHEMIRAAPPLVGNIFPNLTFTCFAGSPDPANQESAVYISFRQWQPISPGVTELWSWIYVYSFFPADYARRSYDTGQNTFSSSGVFEQDDTIVWEGAAKAGRSLMARKRGMALNYKLGQEGMSHYPLDTEWRGPGTRRLSGFGERNQLSFYTRWLKEMREADECR